MMNEFSVLISVYKNDRAEHLDEALSSIFHQTLRARQVVMMVDGPIGSDLDKIIISYQKEYSELELFYEKQNLGLPTMLNLGLSRCKYDLVVRCDADDINHNNRFEVLYNEIKESNYAVIGSTVQEFNEFNDERRIRTVPESYSDIKKMMKQRNPINHPSVIYSKSSVLACGGYNENLKNGQDYELWARLSSNGYKLKNTSECLLSFRVTPEMIKRRGGIKYISYDLIIAKKLRECSFLNVKEFYRFFIIRAISRILPHFLRVILYKHFR
ncbi:glycosyltransferase [Pseudoalteromonas sp. RB2-MNA-CIBAN-0110]|uniref:glycosyltransferase n=1 Tax=Pseudoalteromonas sp. RB2-MNA-CIBAN-0110 TaxID=3140439 RepID=UPI0033255DEF